MRQRVLVISRNGTNLDWPAGYAAKTVPDRPAGVDLVCEWRPDVAILVTDALNRQDIDTVRDLRDSSPEGVLPVLVIAAEPEPEPLVAAIRAGARGFLARDSPPHTVRVAVQTVLAGGGYFGAEATGQLVEHCTAHTAGPLVPEPDERQRRRLLREDAAVLRRMAEELSERVTRHLDLAAAPAAAPVLIPTTATAPDSGSRIIAVAALDTAAGLPEMVRGVLAGLGLDTAVGHAGDVVLVAAPEPDWRKVAPALLDLDRPVHLGISTARTDDDLAAAADDALAALAALRRCGAPADSQLSVEEFTLPMWLAEAADRAALSHRLPASFRKLSDHPTLSRTLTRWLRHDCDVRRAATTMHVHPNTVRYRLSRVEQITQHSLSDLPVLTSLYLTTLAFPGLFVPPAEPVGGPPGRARH